MYTKKEFSLEWQRAINYVDNKVNEPDTSVMALERKFARINEYFIQRKQELLHENKERYYKNDSDLDNTPLTRIQYNNALDKITKELKEQNEDVELLLEELCNNKDKYFKNKLFSSTKVKNMGFNKSKDNELLELAYNQSEKTNFHKLVSSFFSNLIIINTTKNIILKNKEG